MLIYLELFCEVNGQCKVATVSDTFYFIKQISRIKQKYTEMRFIMLTVFISFKHVICFELGVQRLLKGEEEEKTSK